MHSTTATLQRWQRHALIPCRSSTECRRMCGKDRQPPRTGRGTRLTRLSTQGLWASTSAWASHGMQTSPATTRMSSFLSPSRTSFPTGRSIKQARSSRWRFVKSTHTGGLRPGRGRKAINRLSGLAATETSALARRCLEIDHIRDVPDGHGLVGGSQMECPMHVQLDISVRKLE